MMKVNVMYGFEVVLLSCVVVLVLGLFAPSFGASVTHPVYPVTGSAEDLELLKKTVAPLMALPEAEKTVSERQSEIQQFIASQWPDTPFQLTAISGDASFRRYFRVQLSGCQYVLMDAPPFFLYFPLKIFLK